jgi:hypothetical protein
VASPSDASPSDASFTPQALRCVAAVGSAYLVQGIVAGVGGVLLGALAQAGTPLEQQAGLLAGGAIPWVLKFLVALLLDASPSLPLRVRAALLAGLQLCAAACLWGLAAAWAEREASGAGSLTMLAVAWVTLNFVVALQDVLVDNLALDTLRDRPSWAAMAMGVSPAIGLGLLGSVVLGSAIAGRGMAVGLQQPAVWVASLAVLCGALLWIPATPARAGSGSSRERLPSGEQLRTLSGLALMFVAVMFGTYLTGALASEFVIGHLRWDVIDVIRILTPIATIAAIVGWLAMGPLIAKLGPAGASMIAGGGLGVCWLGFACASSWWHAPNLLPVYAGGEATLQSALLVGLHALALSVVARMPLSTTAFVVMMAALNLPRVLAPLLAPTLAELGWVGAFAACGAIQLIAVAGLWPLRRWLREQ